MFRKVSVICRIWRERSVPLCARNDSMEANCGSWRHLREQETGTQSSQSLFSCLHCYQERNEQAQKKKMKQDLGSRMCGTGWKRDAEWQDNYSGEDHILIVHVTMDAVCFDYFMLKLWIIVPGSLPSEVFYPVGKLKMDVSTDPMLAFMWSIKIRFKWRFFSR